MFIKLGDIFSKTLIFLSRRCKEAFGAYIIDILMTRIFPFNGYLKSIKTGTTHSTNQWKSLVQIGFELFDKEFKIEELSFHEKCRYLYKVLQLSSEYSSTWQLVQRRLPEIETWFHSSEMKNSSSDAKLAFLRIINFVQELLQRENRQ